jgi:hypothetical protein
VLGRRSCGWATRPASLTFWPWQAMRSVFKAGGKPRSRMIYPFHLPFSTLISGVLPHGMRDHHRELDTNLISRKVVETPKLAETHRCGGFFG